MALGLDLRKRGGSKTGYVVGRLRTIKSSLRSSKLRRRSRRDKLELESDDDMHGKGRLPSSKSKSVLTGRKLNDRREWKGSVREGKRLNDRSERKGSVREEVKPENTVWRRKKQDDTRDDSKYQNSSRNRVSRDDGRNSELTHQNTEKPSLKQRPKATKTEKRMKDAEGSNYPKDPTLNKIHKRQHGEQVSKSKGVSHQDELHEESIKRTRQKKSSNEESEAVDQRPKKIKKVIRIDPHDISNKRIDDSASSKEKVPEVETELSKNAQFRAIKPSHSILSFVEDNLLGRRRTNELKKAGYNIDLSAPLDNIPFSSSTERERIEESVFRNKLEFFAAAQVSASFPPPVLPEIAFAGRSNVGKSSLLNALTRQWGVVRTSDKPGHTQTINFFRLASKLCLVDLPGYGFAYAKEEVKDAWEELVKEYVSTREGLQRVCLLIDTKWGMKQRDHELIDLMERSRTPYQIVLTKTDLVFPIDIARRAMQIQEDLKTRKSTIEPIMMVSSKSGAGVRSLRTALAKFARFIKP